jgi:hypothetical protein
MWDATFPSVKTQPVFVLNLGVILVLAAPEIEYGKGVEL